ncbi:MAG: hypothetical protein IK118_10700, partial [Clostridia bacterium]|nr:hypothetical protein [Clostridia bacterium]
GLRSRFFRQIVQILRRQPDGWQGEDVQYDGTKIKQDAHSYLCGVALKNKNVPFPFSAVVRLIRERSVLKLSGSILQSEKEYVIINQEES